MQVKFFTIPINALDDHNKELNAFLTNNKIVEFEKELVQTNGNTFWCIYISYIPQNTYSKKEKIDYRSKFTGEKLKNYDKLHNIRTELAKADAVSAYMIATNAELADINKIDNPTLAKLKKVRGFGSKKVETYGQRILDALKTNE